MNLMKKIFGKVGCILLVCFALVGQVFAGEDNKYSTSDVEKFVLEAKDYAIAQGKDKSLKDFMDPNNAKFRRGSLYIFAFDYEGLCLAHIKNAMVGSNMLELKDPNGVTIIKDIINVTKEKPNGGWTEYMWQNPTTNKVEKKYTFAMKVDNGWLLGAGFYESEKK